MVAGIGASPPATIFAGYAVMENGQMDESPKRTATMWLASKTRASSLSNGKMHVLKGIFEGHTYEALHWCGFVHSDQCELMFLATVCFELSVLKCLCHFVLYTDSFFHLHFQSFHINW